ncbi:hypothetical protein DC522_12595 [Microvirga sp. KLBC 81]|nr:hypothetical protein DC522_12595 [Microvirga sp. KLBC 81]
MQQKRIQFGLDPGQFQNLVPDPLLGLLEGLSESGCFGHNRLRVLDQGSSSMLMTTPPDRRSSCRPSGRCSINGVFEIARSVL